MKKPTPASRPSARFETGIQSHSGPQVSESGLIDRLAASVAMRFAPGVDVYKLRTGNRTVAGLNGEEVIFCGTQDGESELGFTWLYTGKADSGDAPKTSIEVE